MEEKSSKLITYRFCFLLRRDEPGSNYTIKAGSLAYFKFEGGGQIRDVSQVIQHPLYNRTTLVNDIAILKLASRLNFTNEVQPVCLPSMNETIPQPGQYVTFTGWGSYRERNGTDSAILILFDIKDA